MDAVHASGARLRAITQPDDPALEEVLKLFRRIFPEYDLYHSYLRLSADAAHPPRATTVDHVWWAEQGGALVAFRLFSYVKGYNFGFGAYTGVDPAVRGQGIGRWLMNLTMMQVCADAAAHGAPQPLGVVIEITPPDAGADAHERDAAERSVAFHQACGARVLDIPYQEIQVGWEDVGTPEQELARKPMLLAAYFPPERTSLSASEQVQLVQGLYRGVYLQPSDTAQERAVLAAIMK
jgi:GNAT superfamily N-acetyltransferase